MDGWNQQTKAFSYGYNERTHLEISLQVFFDAKEKQVEEKEAEKEEEKKGEEEEEQGRIHDCLCRGRLGRGSNELGRGSNELGMGSNDLGRGMLKYKLPNP